MSSNWTETGYDVEWNSIASSQNGLLLYACVTNGRVYKSINYGVTWDVINDLNNIINTNLNWSDIATSSDGTKIFGFVSNGFIYISTDSGNSWNEKHTATDWRGIASSIDGIKLCACAYNDKLHLSDDGGNTWYSIDGNKHFLSICCSFDGNYIYLTEEAGHIITVANRNTPFLNSNITESWSSITCNNTGSKVYASSNIGYIYISTNNGQTFTQLINLSATKSWTCINTSNFGDGRYIAACANNDQIYLSNDYGESWSIKEQVRTWKTIAISSEGTIINAGVNTGNIYNSTNGGISCYLYDTKILIFKDNQEIEEKIQKLKINDIVVTTEGYKKIIYIGNNYIKNINNVKCVPKNIIAENKPNDDLYITNGHSLLFENIDIYKNNNYNEIIYKNINNVNNYKKILASDCNLCIIALQLKNNRYYHLTLENSDIYNSYAIYSNNILSETMSIHYTQHMNDLF